MDAHVLPMSQLDLHRYHTLKLVLEHRITIAQAGVSLGLSPRQIWRLKARLRAEGRCASPEWFRRELRQPAGPPKACDGAVKSLR